MSFEYMSTGHTPNKFRLKELTVFFSDEKCLEIIRKVLDEAGNILNFPGIIEDEIWTSKQRVALCRDVRYEASFYSVSDGKTLMLWLVQPSGWYWMDSDGFGFTGDPSIALYSVIDENGNFEKEFSLFRIKSQRYCNEYDEFLK